MRAKLIQTGYLLGLASFLAAIVYFFAANWGGFSHWEKLGVSTGLLLLLYGLSFLLAYRSKRDYLTDILLVGGSISFGATTALVGQIYNSHADSYLLFLIWLVPVLLLCAVTRKQAFYLLSLLLLELTMWFYIFPSHVRLGSSEKEIMVSLFIAALINGVIFALAYSGRMKSELVQLFSFVVFFGIVTVLANTLVFEEYGWYTNGLAVLVFAGSLTFFLKLSVQKSYALLTGLFASLYVISKYIELAARNFEEWFFFLGIFFFIGLLITNIVFMRYVNRLTARNEQQSDADQNADRQIQKREFGQIIGRTAGIGLTVASIVIGCISIIGFVMMVFESEYLLLGISLAMLAAILLMKGVHSYIRYTVIAIGLALGFFSLMLIDEVTISLSYVILLVAVWWMSRGLYERLMIYSTFAAVFANMDMNWSMEKVIVVSFALHTLIFLLRFVWKEGKATANLAELSFFYSIGFFFWLTFMREGSLPLYYISNAAYFLLTTVIVFVCLKRQLTYYYVTGMVFWFHYVIYKYYDILWSLLHKSITLLVVSGLFFLGTYLYERRGEMIISLQPSIVRRKAVPILLIILLQFGMTGYQIGKSEWILSQGAEIKLKLAPIDPRSLLQGDYVRLNYEVSNTENLPAFDHSNWEWDQKIRVVLQPDANGVYTVKGYQKSNDSTQQTPGEIIMNGTTQGNRIQYGIETFFVPEGKGHDVQSRAQYALVRVGSNGDAILVTLLDESGQPVLAVP